MPTVWLPGSASHRASLALTALVALTACGGGRPAGRTACGLAAVAGPTTLLSEFGVPRQTLGVPPEHLPSRLVARLAAGPSLPAIVGRSDSSWVAGVDSSWVVGIDGPLPAGSKPGFGVLVLDQTGKARGVMLYEGLPVEGAPRIGTVAAGTRTVPLIGIQLDPALYEDSRCPFFPDSVLR